MLFTLLILPIVGALVVFLIPESYRGLVRVFSLLWSLLILNFSIVLFCLFDITSNQLQLFQYVT